jgi:predicted nucleic acid-binding Zn ribbon protein
MSKAEPVSELISNVMRRAAQEHRPLFAIQRRWPKLVGKQLAAHTRPVSLRRGRLVVHADHPGDSFALNFARPRLLEQLQGKGTGGVEEIVIRAGDV